MSDDPYVETLVAERDRLRERLDSERRHRIAAVDREVEAIAERDRLRAVVENIRDYTAKLPGEKMSRVWAVTAQILERDEVSVLDVSPTIGGASDV